MVLHFVYSHILVTNDPEYLMSNTINYLKDTNKTSVNGATELTVVDCKSIRVISFWPEKEVSQG